MNWFNGEIADAIAHSKAKEAIFVVFVNGNDEKSSQITEIINNAEISKTLGSASFVAIKIEAGSIPYQQFSQIYKQVPVPSLYFIGKKGIPLEIVTEPKDTQTFLGTLKSILQKAGLSPVGMQSESFINNEQTSSGAENVTASVQNEASSENILINSETSTVEQQESSVEEKVERAKQLVEKKREEKKKEESESERQKEIERRKMGQNVQQLKRWQEDQELKNIMEEREKEKRETQAARERVLAQIAQDKAERAARFSNVPPQQPQTSSQATPPRPVNTNMARLQFRLPDGATNTQDFLSSETLESVHSHIRTNLNLSFSNYTLSTTFPRREFTDSDRSQTLLDLQLAPTAVILILPLNRGAVTTNNPSGFSGMLWSLLTPFLAILDYFKGFVFGTAVPRSDRDSKRSAESSTEPSTQSKVRRAGETTVVKRQGNVHRLSHKDDSDDENNTWNGNSTQQM